MTTHFKTTFCLAVVLVTISATSCGGRNKANVADTSPTADTSTEAAEAPYAEISYPIELNLNKEHPKKTIVLQDVVGVNYIPLETDNDLLLDVMAQVQHYVSDSLIVVRNKQDDIFVMGRDGRLVSKFNRKGRGPNEYSRIQTYTVDFDDKEIYVYDIPFSFRIVVYSFGGEYRRTIDVGNSLWLLDMMNYDRDHLLVWAKLSPDDMKNGTNEYKKPFRPYYLVSKRTGKLMPLPIEVAEHKDGMMYQSQLAQKDLSTGKSLGFKTSPLISNRKEMFISDYMCDTVYTLRDGKLSPYAVKKLSNGNARMDIRCGLMLKTARYSFFDVMEFDIDAFRIVSKKIIGLDHSNGEMFEAEFRNGDFAGDAMWGEGLSPDGYFKTFPAEQASIAYQAMWLTDARDAGQLRGRLAEVAATLKEDDNPVVMLIKFKK